MSISEADPEFKVEAAELPLYKNYRSRIGTRMSKKRRATKEKVGMKLSDWVESGQSANHSKKDQTERKDMGKRWRGGAQARACSIRPSGK